jgi:very-short-patch-repair endonuclease
MHKRTTPKIFGHAKENHRNLTPAEAKLWARLRAHRMKEIHFRNQHAIGNFVVDFPLTGTSYCAAKKARNRSGWGSTFRAGRI